MARHSNILAACWKWLAGIICQMRTCLATQHWIIQLCLFLQCVQWSQCSANEGRNSQPDRSKIIRQQLTRDALLPCKLLRGRDLGQVQWWYRAVGKQLIGTFDANSRSSNVTWSRDGAYQILENGTLFVKNVRRELVERYECAANSSEGRELRDDVYLRLDFSFWYAPEPFSMFFGSCLAALVFCAASFVLNIVWIFVRWVVLRCIKRAERLSRVRSMLEAMEKYRHRQMESIHEGYSRRMSAIRDNYHYQMEMLRQSYADSADRFRDYRQAQMDNVQQHLDNYYQQISRLREFGSRHVEQLWESYDRSLTAVRTFTLEQRLKILNQYKVKQRYVNKLLEAIATETNVDLISRKEAAIRDVLGEEELPPPVWPPTLQSSNVTAPMAGVCGKVPIPRSASYYSLPEFMVEEEEGLVEQQQRQQPITAAAEEVELCQQPSTSGSSQSTRDTRVHLEC